MRGQNRFPLMGHKPRNVRPFHPSLHLARIGRPVWADAVLAIVLAVLWRFTFHHYFMGAITVCYGFVIGWFAGWLAKRRQVSH